MKFTSLVACASSALAFSNTAAFYSSHQLVGDGLKYITKSEHLRSAFERLTSDFCLLSPGEILTVYRVGRLSREQPDNSDEKSTFIKHVHYQSGSDVDLPISEACSIAYVDEFPADVSKISANVVVVDVEDSQTHTVGEYLGRGKVVVQGKPGFREAGTRGESLKDFIGDKLNLDFDTIQKRDLGDSLLDKESDALLEEAENDFELAELLIAAQESDARVTALSDDSKLVEGSGALKNGTSRSNLFTHYQFFTPGVWLVLIVCFFLVYVCVTAVSWITSIDLSYRSFEKQVEYEKKVE